MFAQTLTCRHFALAALAAAGACLACAPAVAQPDLVFYDDALAPGWADWSWATTDLASTERAYTGSRSVKVTMGSGGSGLELTHYRQFNTRAYGELGFFIYGSTGAGLAVAAVVGPTQEVLAPVSLLPYVEGTGPWHRVRVPLAALGVTDRAVNRFRLVDTTGGAQSPFYIDDVRLTGRPLPASVQVAVDATRALRRLDSKPFGLNTGMWDSAFFHPDTPALLTNVGTGLMRFPGGSSSDQYHWKTHTVENSNWIPPVTFDQFATTARTVGARPLVTVNYGSGTPQEAAEWVHYANIVRGYGIRDWEVGNEVFGSWEYDTHPRPHDPYTYAVAAAEFITRMKAVDPTIRVGVVVEPGEESYSTYFDHPATNPRTGRVYHGWTPVMLSTLRALGATPDFLSYNRYTQAQATEDDALLLQTPAAWRDDAADLRQQLSDYLGEAGSQVRLVCAEANSTPSALGKQTTSLVNGLFLADMLGELLRTEFESLTWFSFRNTLFDSPNYTANNSAALYGWRPYGDAGLLSPYSQPYPTYHVARLLTQFAVDGDEVVEATSSHGTLAAHAVRRPDGSVHLLVINKHATATLRTNITLAGLLPRPVARIHTYGIRQDEAARTGVGTATAESWEFGSAASAFTYDFAPYSATVIQLKP